MRVKNTDLEKKIRSVCLGLLMEKEPEEIGMRDIALGCGVSATTIYYYYADKERLFDAVKLDCLGEMDAYIEGRAAAARTVPEKLREAITAFRDWAFGNPRVALLVMGRLKPTVNVPPEELRLYYRSTDFARDLLDAAVAEGHSAIGDTRLASALCISAVWGAIESVLINRTYPEYWEKGIFFTDRMIGLCLEELLGRGEK